MARALTVAEALPEVLDPTPEIARAIDAWLRAVEEVRMKDEIYALAAETGRATAQYRSYLDAVDRRNRCWRALEEAWPIHRRAWYVHRGRVWGWTKASKRGFELVCRPDRCPLTGGPR